MERVTPVEVKSFLKGIVVFKATCIPQSIKRSTHVWNAAVGEELVRKGEPESASDPYAVAMKKEGFYRPFA